jgi:hypothetical protein
MRDVEAIEEWKGQDVVDPDGEKLGKLEEVWFRAGEDEPVLAAVKSGVLGRKHNLVPFAGSTVSRDFVRVKYTKLEVQDAPAPEDESVLSQSDLGRVGDHYGVDIDGPENAQLESGAARAARLAAAQEAIDRAAELEAQAKRAEESAHVAAGRSEQASQELDTARADRDDAAQRAAAARAEAAAALEAPGSKTVPAPAPEPEPPPVPEPGPGATAPDG